MRKTLVIVLTIVAAVVVVGWINLDWIMARVYLTVLESDGRVRSLQIERVLETLEVGPGQVVVDLGAGTGLFSRPLAAAVAPDGRAYAVDINADLLSHIERTAAAEGLVNLVTVLASADDPRIPEPADLILICDTLHHIPDRSEYLKTLRRYLRPGGRVAVIDFQDSVHVLPSMHYSLEALDGWARAAGLTRTASYDFLGRNFFVVFSCEECPGG